MRVNLVAMVTIFAVKTNMLQKRKSVVIYWRGEQTSDFITF